MTVALVHRGTGMPARPRVPAGAPRGSASPAAPRADGWRIYLVLSAILAPLCVPAGPGQSSALDFLNLAALAAFALALLGPGRRLRAPLFAPMALCAVGSLVATLNAASAGNAALALVQDAYLFGWFLLIVNVVRDPADLRAVRRAWAFTAVAVALVAVVQFMSSNHGSLGSLFDARGARPAGTLYNPNMLADYLVLSLFVTASLAGEIPGALLAAALGTLLLGLVASKSNGGLLTLLGGAAVWLAMGAATGGRHLRRLVAVGALLVSVAGVVLWFGIEWGVGEQSFRALTRHTFVGRYEKSTASRWHIWEQLERSYARSPLGIGPGNSGALTLSIAERERRDSYQSKEAHSDYLAYAIERGPLALVGLLLMLMGAFFHVARYWRNARLRPDGAPADDVAATRRARLWTMSMAAALAASALHSLVIEKLHFRHYWLLLALVCGSSLMAARPALARVRCGAPDPVPAQRPAAAMRLPARVREVPS